MPLPEIASPAEFDVNPIVFSRTSVAVFGPTLFVNDTTLYLNPSTPLSITLYVPLNSGESNPVESKNLTRLGEDGLVLNSWFTTNLVVSNWPMIEFNLIL